MKRPLWFKAKRYGWGWYPCTWQGWLITAGFLALILGNAYLFRPEEDSAFLQVLPMLMSDVLLVAILIGICYLTGEKPRWRWGGKD